MELPLLFLGYSSHGETTAVEAKVLLLKLDGGQKASLIFFEIEKGNKKNKNNF